MLRYQAYEGIGLLHGSYARHHFAPHFHDEYSVAVIMSGALVFRWSGDQHVASPAMISAVNPGEVHNPTGAIGWEYRHFFIPTAALAHYVPELEGATPDIAEPVLNDPETARALIRAHQAVHSGASDLEKDALLTDAFGQLFSKHAAPGPRHQRLASRLSTRRAEDYIRANFAEQIRLATLADLVKLSPYHFLRTFARDTGLTPHAYQEQVRIAYAMRRLKAGAPAIEIANDAGYADQSHFIRALKRTYGFTPSVIQRAA